MVTQGGMSLGKISEKWSRRKYLKDVIERDLDLILLSEDPLFRGLKLMITGLNKWFTKDEYEI